MSDDLQQPAAAAPFLVIEASNEERNYWTDLWRFRELFYFLTWRDVIVRYKQTAIGIAWAVLQPLLTTVVFSVFGMLLKLPTGGVPRPVLIFAAQLPWSFFSTSLSGASNSMTGNAHLISKVYFPRLIIPASSVALSFVDFLISALFLGIMMAVFQVVPDARILLLPFFMVIAVGAALGVGLLLATLSVKYRDFRFILPFILQFGFYISPIAFTSDLVPERWRTLYHLNPMVGVIDGFRWSLLNGRTALDWGSVWISCAVVAVLLAFSVWFFRKTERTFADII